MLYLTALIGVYILIGVGVGVAFDRMAKAEDVDATSRSLVAILILWPLALLISLISWGIMLIKGQKTDQKHHK